MQKKIESYPLGTIKCSDVPRRHLKGFKRVGFSGVAAAAADAAAARMLAKYLARYKRIHFHLDEQSGGQRAPSSKIALARQCTPLNTQVPIVKRWQTTRNNSYRG